MGIENIHDLQRLNERIMLKINELDSISSDWRFLEIQEGQGALDTVPFNGIAYPILFEDKDLISVDRTESMLSGPFYTSDEFPWPLDSEGQPATPLVQLDLRSVSDKGHQSFSDELLQVWIFQDVSTILRCIPRKYIELGNMSEVSLPMLQEQNLIYGSVRVIVDFGAAFFSCANSYISVAEEASSEVIELKSMMDKLASKVEDFQLFGTFSPLQYSHDEVGKHLLMSLCSGGGLALPGVDATGHIFYEIVDGNPEFSFLWSC